MKLTPQELRKLSKEELTNILKKEGNSPCDSPKYNEWLDIFELMSMCRVAELSELETWCVLRSRFSVEKKTLTDERNEKIETILG